MARIKFAYIGGGSTRAAGTMASFMEQGENFNGSEVVLIDLNEDTLKVVQKISEKLARAKGLDIKVSITTDRREGLKDCDAVLTSYRPGGFEARYLDESIPLKHGIIGQETQGPGGFFMALRSLHIMKGIIQDMEEVCPNARLFNYTNPINLISQAVTKHSSIPTISFCEGPIVTNAGYASWAGLDPEKLDAVSIGLNHGSWTVRHLYEGQDFIPMLAEAYERKRQNGELEQTSPWMRRLVELAIQAESLPSHYFQYYYFTNEIYQELLNKPTTRAQDIMASVPDYWAHYREEAEKEVPHLDPARSRGGIHELELALDVMDAIYNDRKEVWYVNVPNNGAIKELPDDLVVELVGFVDKNGVQPLQQGALPRHLSGLVKELGEYQYLTAEAAWAGTRKDAIKALASNPLVRSFAKAEALYDEMAAAHKAYLPERLLH
ncbi:6-phospho-beta-glucosidase [Thermosporothrix hazakensis]|jgi:6-phospho-beta-glucosidase|uniref:6-phospho-beta-glucosidase n=2 Tax=Thermosporothrix TaxID=768650 RepID=A0A326U9F4_THEHA|nr:glycoside hydrolase [Thermosporothrix hazakensis]PZW32826.1 6-phospho-beta-glucosidase [Thermosporothrix hazakensis]BBH90807.1 6-phospho-beta-glucosidase [Thermosporothrix sp. COM3]GCE48857.1 6-phospho-beta-glucosidase [Thermosporothrix hazakensis]